MSTETRRPIRTEDVITACDTLQIPNGVIPFLNDGIHYVWTPPLCKALGLYIDEGYQNVEDVAKKLNEELGIVPEPNDSE